jgi:multiple sugar transport system permease protein
MQMRDPSTRWLGIGRTICHRLAVLGIVAFILAPIYVLLLVSVTKESTELSGTPQWLPSLTWANFAAVLNAWQHFFGSMPVVSAASLVLPGLRNSLEVAFPVAIFNMLIAAPAGYVFGRLRFPGSRALALAMLSTQMLPSLVLVVPFFVMFRHLDLTNSLLGVGLADLSITLPFTIWIIANAVQDVPVELERAARVDGLSRLASIFRVTIPLAKSGIRTGGLFSFLFSWNDLIFPLILIVSPSLIMIQPAIAGMYSDIASDFGAMSAAAILAIIPPLIVAITALRTLAKGLMSGAVKG